MSHPSKPQPGPPAAGSVTAVPQGTESAVGESRGSRAAPAPPAHGDYRDALRSRRWDAAPLRNPEVGKTDPRIAVAFIVALCALTLLILVLGYGSGFWSLPA